MTWHGGVSTGDWVCSQCDTWVMPGETHVCWQAGADWQPIYCPPHPRQQWDPVVPLLERIAACLERLEEAIGG